MHFGQYALFDIDNLNQEKSRHPKQGAGFLLAG